MTRQTDSINWDLNEAEVLKGRMHIQKQIQEMKLMRATMKDFARHQPHRHYSDCRVKIDIALFDGHLHFKDYLDWEYAMESFLECMKNPVERQIRYI